MKTSVLEFRLLDDIFCFNTSNIEYVFELEKYEDIKGMHESVIGITKYNDDVMLLIDTAKLYSDKSLDLGKEKSVIVIKSDENMRYGMVVDEITKLEEIESVKLSVELTSDDMIVNHYKEEDRIVSEIHPLPLFKKYDIPAISPLYGKTLKNQNKKSNSYSTTYLLFKINENSYAIKSESVKEVVEKSSKIFRLEKYSSVIKGAIPIRDEVIPVIDMEECEDANDIIVVEVEHKKFAIEVNEVYDIENFENGKIEKINNEISAVDSFYNHNENVIAIVNPEFYLKELVKSETAVVKDEYKTENAKVKKDYLVFFIGSKKYSIDMSCVRQVVETSSLSKTNSSSIISDENIEFIATWNHRAVNIVNLKKELNFQTINKEEESQSVFVESDNHVVAFVVDDIDNIIYLDEDKISVASSESENIIKGAIIYENEVIAVLNEKFISLLG